MVLSQGSPALKMCYLMLAHEHPVLCARLARRLLEDGSMLVIHLDLKAPEDFKAQMKEALGTRYEAILWAKRVSVEWGEWSMVEATLNGLESIRSQPSKPDYVYLLSGADYPIRPLQQLKSYLQRHRGAEFIESVPGDTVRWVQHGIQTDRYAVRHWLNWRKTPRLFTLSIRLQQLLRMTRSMPEPLQPHLGAQWWLLTWSTCERALDLARDPVIEKFFRTTWVPDELFFQTVVRNIVSDPALIHSRHLTHYIFSAYGVPQVFHDSHIDYLTRQPFFFARKISPKATRLRDALDELNQQSSGEAAPDDRVGIPTDDYEDFLKLNRHGLRGKPSWGQPGEPPLGALERNLRPYFLLRSDCAETLELARTVLHEDPQILCHGRLFARDRMELHSPNSIPGITGQDLAMRDQDRRSLFADLVAHSDGLTGYCWHTREDPIAIPPDYPDWKPAFEFDMANVHLQDPQCFVIDLVPAKANAAPGTASAVSRSLEAHSAIQQRLIVSHDDPGFKDSLRDALREPLKLWTRQCIDAAPTSSSMARIRKGLKTLYIHIGIHRTGTTAIQKLLHNNRKELHEQGYHYALDTENHTDLTVRLESSRRTARDVVRELIADGQDAPGHSVIVSGEDLCRLRDVGRLAELNDHFDVRVIAYLRRQDHWLESWYNQNIKWPWNAEASVMTPQEFLERRDWYHWLDYATMLNNWVDVFGRANITAVVYEEARQQQPFTNGFCEICGIDPDKLSAGKPAVNASAPPQAVEFLRHMKLFEKQGKSRQMLLKKTSKVFQEAGLDTVRHVFSEQERLNILSEFRDSNSRVAREFFDRLNGVLFTQPLPGNDPTTPPIELPELMELQAVIAQPLVLSYLEPLLAPGESREVSRDFKGKLHELERRRSALIARQQRIHDMTFSRKSMLQHLLRKIVPERTS